MTDSTKDGGLKMDAEFLSDMREGGQVLLKQANKIPLICFSDLCFTRIIFYLLLTGCSFIPIRLDDDANLIIFVITSIVIMILTYFILQESTYEPEVPPSQQWAYAILFFLCLVGYPHFSVFRYYEERHYILLFPCVLDLFFGILYKYCYITKHYIVFLPILVAVWGTYAGLNLFLYQWKYFAFVFGFFTFTLGTRALTLYQMVKNKDDRLCYPLFGVCEVLAFHFLPISAVFAAGVSVCYCVLKCDDL